MSATVLRLSHETKDELIAKLRAVAFSLGYRLEPISPPRLTVAELARRVNRPVSTVSMSLRRKSCPAFFGLKGKRRYLWIEPTDELLDFLASWRKGQR